MDARLPLGPLTSAKLIPGGPGTSWNRSRPQKTKKKQQKTSKIPDILENQDFPGFPPSLLSRDTGAIYPFRTLGAVVSPNWGLVQRGVWSNVGSLGFPGGEGPPVVQPGAQASNFIGVRGPRTGYLVPGCGRGRDLDRAPMVMSRRRRRRRPGGGSPSLL